MQLDHTALSYKQRCVYTNQKLIRETSNLLFEIMYTIVLFEIDAFFASLKKALPNKSFSEILESLRS